MQSSEMRQLMSNPEALRAMMQVQQGMQQLQSAAPGLFSGQGYAPVINGNNYVSYCILPSLATVQWE